MRTGAGGLIIKDKRILLIKRGINSASFAGYWGLLGGKSEEGESPEDTVIREVKEEVNLDFIPIELFSKGEVMNAGKLFLGHRFLGNFSGEIRIQESEIDGFGWFTYDETKELKLAFDYGKCIKDLHAKGYL